VCPDICQIDIKNPIGHKSQISFGLFSKIKKAKNCKFGLEKAKLATRDKIYGGTCPPNFWTRGYVISFVPPNIL